MKSLFKNLLLLIMFNMFFTSCSVNDDLIIKDNLETIDVNPPNEDDDPETEETGG